MEHMENQKGMIRIFEAGAPQEFGGNLRQEGDTL